jgi:hypothetical protein
MTELHTHSHTDIYIYLYSVKRGLQALREHSTHLNEQKRPS